MSAIHTAFKDEARANAFLQDGFCNFPLFTEEEIDYLHSIFLTVNGNANRLNQSQFYGVNYSLGTLSADENEAVMLPVQNLLEDKLQQYFSDFEVMGCVFITKPPKTDTVFLYHQDWNYTHEDKYAFATCWVPLCNTTTRNGCMTFVKGTHKLFNTYRSTSLASSRIAFEDIPAELRTDVEQSIGECVAFHQAVFHGSYPNVTDNSRPVLGFVVKPKAAPVVHYVLNNNNADVFEMDVAAFNTMLTTIPNTVMPANAVYMGSKNIPPLPTATDIVTEWRIAQSSFKLFKDETLHRKFTTNGFVKLNGIVNHDVLDQLKNLYATNFSAQNGMYVTHHKVTDIEHNKKISAAIYSLLNDMLQNTFADYQTLISHFAVKGTGGNGIFNFHQDWSIVEEELFGVLHCWVPLHDTDNTNGTLAVLPGSHLMFHNYRSGDLPIHFTPIANHLNEAVFLNAKAGDVVFYHPALFHGSGENLSATPRLAIVAGLANKNARKVYYRKQGDEILQFEFTDTDLFSRLDALAQGGTPTGNFISFAPFRALPEANKVEAILKSIGSHNKVGENVEV